MRNLHEKILSWLLGDDTIKEDSVQKVATPGLYELGSPMLYVTPAGKPKLMFTLVSENKDIAVVLTELSNPRILCGTVIDNVMAQIKETKSTAQKDNDNEQ